MRVSRSACCVVLVFSAAVSSRGDAVVAPSPVLAAAKAELQRSFEQLKKQPAPTYFLSYEIAETDSVRVEGSFGTLLDSGEHRNRRLLIDLRVGDYNLDNTREVRGQMPRNMSDRFSNISVPLDDDPDALRAVLWYETDRKYKRSVEQLTTVQTNSQVKVEQEDKSGDFSKEAPQQATEPIATLTVDRKAWEEKVRKYTAAFQRFGNIYEANATLTANRDTRWFVSSEGSQLQTSQTYYCLFIYAFAKSDDGMELPRYESFFSFTPGGLPDDAAVLKVVGSDDRGSEGSEDGAHRGSVYRSGDSLEPGDRRFLP